MAYQSAEEGGKDEEEHDIRTAALLFHHVVFSISTILQWQTKTNCQINATSDRNSFSIFFCNHKDRSWFSLISGQEKVERKRERIGLPRWALWLTYRGHHVEIWNDGTKISRVITSHGSRLLYTQHKASLNDVKLNKFMRGADRFKHNDRQGGGGSHDHVRIPGGEQGRPYPATHNSSTHWSSKNHVFLSPQWRQHVLLLSRSTLNWPQRFSMCTSALVGFENHKFNVMNYMITQGMHLQPSRLTCSARRSNHVTTRRKTCWFFFQIVVLMQCAVFSSRSETWAG